MPVTELQYSTTKQGKRIFYAKIYLLNYNMQIVDELSGVVIGTPSFNNNASSDIRRTCNIDIYAKDESFDIKEGNKIWVDKYLKIEIGIKDVRTGTIEYTNMGIYVINNPNRVYNSNTNTLSIEGLDLVSKLTGLRNGELEGLDHVIPANTNVRTAIIGVLALAGFNNYSVDECTVAVPNEIKVSVGGTAWDLLKQLRDILPQYQMYFDVDGVFHYNLIPSGADEQIMVADDTWSKVLLSYNVNTDFENIKNSVTVFGKTHDINYFGGTITASGSTYNMTISGITALRNNLKIGFVAVAGVSSPYINLNSYGAKALKNEDGTFPTLSTNANVYYVAKYLVTGDYWLFMGEVTPKASIEETNVDSPFYVNGNMGRVHKNFFGGEYDNIYMTTLALARAKWELYNYCRIQDNITLTCVPIYYLDVNSVIEITLPNKQGTEETNKYIVKQINTTLGKDGVQTITAMKYYAYYYDEELTVMDGLYISDNLVVE